MSLNQPTILYFCGVPECIILLYESMSMLRNQIGGIVTCHVTRPIEPPRLSLYGFILNQQPESGENLMKQCNVGWRCLSYFAPFSRVRPPLFPFGCSRLQIQFLWSPKFPPFVPTASKTSLGRRHSHYFEAKHSAIEKLLFCHPI